MAKLKIYKYPDIVLTQKALPIGRVDKSWHKLADDMLETMYDAPGIGLAANQVGILSRIIVLDTDFEYEEPEDEDSFEDGVITGKNPRIVINPEIILHEGKITWPEGCLSVPEYTADVKRAAKIKLQYLDIDGLTQTLAAEGLLAVAIQHEIDHLDGKLFIDRLSPLKKEMVRKRLRQERAEREADERMGSPFPGSRKSKKKKKEF